MRDRECRADGCTIPATWCEAHHRQPWSAGGKTDLDNGMLLCSHHHHLIHDDRYLHQRMPNGDLRFVRRT
ncbi:MULTISPECIES: HNH endonuclease signature motif containing protein [unclassified Nocardioides]|uniref:HNH endonuclease signature motif containing protein n=1 Tax=unclassified Nocardioides TaxID=2615069 RepID=UPI002B1FA71B|nr:MULTISPECIES: HNH endonuclease signature motif containing protein [unclassified Nocardioides]